MINEKDQCFMERSADFSVDWSGLDLDLKYITGVRSRHQYATVRIRFS
ncbi:protein of unknown function [Burkholderia multivorans]